MHERSSLAAIPLIAASYFSQFKIIFKIIANITKLQKFSFKVNSGK